MYIVHDRLSDTYHAYKHLSKVARYEKLSYNTLVNKFQREKLDRHVTKDAKVITKTNLI